MDCLQTDIGKENCVKDKQMLIPKPYIRSPLRERAKFYDAKKSQTETVTEYYTKLRNLSISCEFNDNFDDRVLCDKFITGFRSGFIFDQLCDQNKDITLHDALELALTFESDPRSSSTETHEKVNSKTKSIMNKFNILPVEEVVEMKSDPLEYLDVSVADIQNPDRSFVCYLCNNSFDNMKDCQHHITKHHLNSHSHSQINGNKSKKYFCEICGKSCDRRHFLIHTNDKKFKCQVCSKRFNSSTNCRAHQQSHNADNPYKCNTCSREFKQKRHLQRHLDVHFGEKRFKCNVCSQMFRLKATLTNHLRLHETSKLNCDYCKLRFRDRTKFDIHIQKHINVKKQCEICGKTVKYMKAHMDHHNSPRSHECPFCEKKFIRRQGLLAHEKLHTGLDCFACHICDKKFNRENSLKAHLIRHTSKTFACDTCGKTFFRNDELGRHILSHSGVKNFKCHHCDTRFTCLRSKLRHIKNKHPQGK